MNKKIEKDLEILKETPEMRKNKVFIIIVAILILSISSIITIWQFKGENITEYVEGKSNQTYSDAEKELNKKVKTSELNVKNITEKTELISEDIRFMDNGNEKVGYRIKKAHQENIIIIEELFETDGTLYTVERRYSTNLIDVESISRNMCEFSYNIEQNAYGVSDKFVVTNMSPNEYILSIYASNTNGRTNDIRKWYNLNINDKDTTTLFMACSEEHSESGYMDKSFILVSQIDTDILYIAEYKVSNIEYIYKIADDCSDYFDIKIIKK